MQSTGGKLETRALSPAWEPLCGFPWHTIPSSLLLGSISTSVRATGTGFLSGAVSESFPLFFGVVCKISYSFLQALHSGLSKIFIQ